MPRQIVIDPLSVVPLFIESSAGDQALGSGTGFVVEKGPKRYLVTNWHVLSARNPVTGEPLSSTGEVPDRVGIWYHVKTKLGSWHRVYEGLTDSNGVNRWLEHSKGCQVDVVLLEVADVPDVEIYSLDLSLADTDLIISPSEPVSIVGYPFGLASSGKFPIWKTGHVASDIDLDYDGQPVFIIDATTKPGMSGSPVFARRIGMHRTSSSMNMGGEATRFLGVYSGRIHDQADIGMVWRAEVVRTMIDAAD